MKAAKAKVAKVATESIALNAVMMMTLAGEHAGSKVKVTKAAKVAKVAKVATESIVMNAAMTLTLAGMTAGSKVKVAMKATMRVVMKYRTALTAQVTTISAGKFA